MINVDKGQMPSQTAVYLGFVLDTRRMVFSLPEKKVAKMLEQVGDLIKRRKLKHHVREVALWWTRFRLVSACESLYTGALL